MNRWLLLPGTDITNQTTQLFYYPVLIFPNFKSVADQLLHYYTMKEHKHKFKILIYITVCFNR
jgi:hypothetical protein